ncbi:MAG TPA: ABC transporter permease, partial [Planctomycetota bacterium]|nr:ABC transporter permease [Planctomycetota bacterium]
MRPLFHLVAKEWLVLSRDWHALLLLFAMPVLFILVMSLALRDRFASHHGASLSYYLLDDDRDALGPSVEEKLRAEESFALRPSAENEAELLARVAKDEAHFLVVIPQGFGAAIANKEPIPIRVASGPGVEPAALKLFEAAVRGIATRLSTERQIARMQSAMPEPPRDAPPRPTVDLDATEKLVQRVTAGGEA